MTLRRALFWCHLIVGLCTGVVLVFLAATGSILALQDPVIALTERGLRSTVSQICVSPASAVQAARENTHQQGASITLYADPQKPSLFTVSNDTVFLVDACSGALLQTRPSSTRRFFSRVKDLHRFVALAGVRHESLRAVKDAVNLLFVFMLLSGLVLWMPRRWSRAHLKSAGLVRPTLRGRAREWNLHNVAGFWFALPLLAISVTGTIMAYGWANGVLYRAAGTPLPKAAEEIAQGKAAVDVTFLDPLVATAKLQDTQWKAMLIRLPKEADKNVSFTIDDRLDNQPSGRNLLMLSRKGKIVRWEPFHALPRGRRWRLDVRFLHSGDLLGIPGRVVMFLAALMLVLLVWTGASLSIRRVIAWWRRTVRKHQDKPVLRAV